MNKLIWKKKADHLASIPKIFKEGNLWEWVEMKWKNYLRIRGNRFENI